MLSTRGWARGVGGLVLVALWQAMPAWALEYTFEPVDMPYAGTTATVPAGLNARAVVVGTYLITGGESTGFRWRAGRVTPLLRVIPQAISDQGLIVGIYVDQTLHGFLFDFSTGQFQTLDVPRLGPDDPFPLLTEARGVSADRTQVVGDFRDTSGFHGFVFTVDPPRFVRVDVPGALLTVATGVSPGGTVVGFYQDGSEAFHGFLRDASGTVTPLDIPDGIGRGGTEILGINEAGVVVGIVSLDPTDASGNRGFVWDQGEVTLIQAEGAVMTQVTGINRHGQLSGWYVDASGQGHGFLATPTPEPSAARAHQKRAQALVRGSVALGTCPAGSQRWHCRQ